MVEKGFELGQSTATASARSTHAWYDEQAIAELRRWSRASDGAYAENTQRAWQSDWRRFCYYCLRMKCSALPAAPAVVARYVRFRTKQRRKPATIRRHLSTISKAHQASGRMDPGQSNEVKLAMRAAAKRRSEQKQARGLVWAEIEHFLSIEPERLGDHRDRALVMVAYDTMCRSEELVALDDGSVSYTNRTVRIPHSKTDQDGIGQYCFLSALSTSLLSTWIEKAGIQEGALFRTVVGKARLGVRLKSHAITGIFRRVGLRIGLPWSEVRRLSGHSARVGATQDQLAANIEVGAIMNSGRWVDARMVTHYGAHLLAQRSGAARLAALQGR